MRMFILLPAMTSRCAHTNLGLLTVNVCGRGAHVGRVPSVSQ